MKLQTAFPSSPPSIPAATNWATYWEPDIARYLVAYEEVTGIPLTEVSAQDRSTQPADAIERR